MCTIPRGRDGKNPVAITVNDQCRHVDFCEVFAEIGAPRGDAVESGFGRGAGGDVPTETDNFVADAFAAKDVDVVEIR